MRRPEIPWIPMLAPTLLACAGNSALDTSPAGPSPGGTTTEEETPTPTDVFGHVGAGRSELVP